MIKEIKRYSNVELLDTRSAVVVLLRNNCEVKL